MVAYLRDVHGSRPLYHTPALVNWVLTDQLLFTGLSRTFTQAKSQQNPAAFTQELVLKPKILYICRPYGKSSPACLRQGLPDSVAVCIVQVQPTLQIDNIECVGT